MTADESTARIWRETMNRKLQPVFAVGMGWFAAGQRVRKTRGSRWQGRVVGFYTTELTPVGYAVESETEIGSVQIYPESALEPVPEGGADVG